MDLTRLEQQLEFILEIDKLKRVYRQTYLLRSKDKENDAEHSWHLAVMAMLLQEYGAREMDLTKVIKMLLVHDLVEIDAGDSFCYDEEAYLDKGRREDAAAARLFSLLPRDQGQVFQGLWQEFEARETAEARFAASLDRLQPLLHNYHTKGISWQEHGVTEDMVLKRNGHICEGAPKLWEYAKTLISDAVDKGYLQRSGEEQKNKARS